MFPCLGFLVRPSTPFPRNPECVYEGALEVTDARLAVKTSLGAQQGLAVGDPAVKHQTAPFIHPTGLCKLQGYL